MNSSTRRTGHAWRAPRLRRGRASALADALLVAAAAVVALAALPCAAFADGLDYLEPFGFADARLMGMGYSYVALWDAPNPLYSNPASFGLGQDRLVLSIGAGWPVAAAGSDADSGPELASDSDAGVAHVHDDFWDDFRFVSVSDVERGAGAGGFAWGQHRWREGESLFSGNTFNYMVGKRFADWGALGVGFRYLRGSGSTEGDVEPLPGWRGLATDAGLIVRSNVFALGVIARDATVTRIAFDDGDSETIAPTYSCGLSLRLGQGAVLAVDAHGISGASDDQEVYSGGFEGWLGKSLAVRAGIILGDGSDRAARAYTGGLGLRLGDFELSYAALLAGEEQQVRRHCLTLTRRF